MIYRVLAEAYHWTPDQIDDLTFEQVEMLLIDKKDLKSRHSARHASARDKAFKKTIAMREERAAKNLARGRHWDAKE